MQRLSLSRWDGVEAPERATRGAAAAWLQPSGGGSAWRCSGASWATAARRRHARLQGRGTATGTATRCERLRMGMDGDGRDKPLTCTYSTLVNLGECPECDWGSRGRRFKSCQPDSETAGQRRVGPSDQPASCVSTATAPQPEPQRGSHRNVTSGSPARACRPPPAAAPGPRGCRCRP
jgi:hypothetical protein